MHLRRAGGLPAEPATAAAAAAAASRTQVRRSTQFDIQRAWCDRERGHICPACAARLIHSVFLTVCKCFSGQLGAPTLSGIGRTCGSHLK